MARKYIVAIVVVLGLAVVGYFYWRRRRTVGQASTAASAALGGNTFLGSNILSLTNRVNSAVAHLERPVGGPQ